MRAATNLEAELIAAGKPAQAADVRAKYVTPLLDADPRSLTPAMREYADRIRSSEAEEAAAKVAAGS